MFTLSKLPRSPEELLRVPVPKSAHWLSRAAKSRWRPIQHGELALTLLTEAERQGLRVSRHRWVATGPELTELYGSVDFAGAPGLEMPDGVAFSVGVRHSNAGRHALSLVTGGRVMVCTNGLLMGDRILSHRHTDGLELGAVLREGVEAALSDARALGGWVRQMRSTPLGEACAERLLIAGARQGVLSWSAMRQVDAAWLRPPHPEFEARSAWSLYNAFTEVARRRSPAVQLKALRGLKALFGPEALLEMR